MYTVQSSAYVTSTFYEGDESSFRHYADSVKLVAAVGGSREQAAYRTDRQRLNNVERTPPFVVVVDEMH